jgi:YidC/Oxa1 family membrane protein insertase
VPILANVIQEAFSPLISVCQAVLVFVHDHFVGGSWGLAIVGMTVLVRAVMVPLTLRQLRSMQKMQFLAPKLKEIQAKYKDDKQRQQQEIVKFYREHKVNPLASCLPLLLQLPLFISLFYMLRADLKKHICGARLLNYYNTHHHPAVSSIARLPAAFIEKTACQTVAPHSAKFLFLPDITAKATGAALVVLLVAYVASMVASTRLTTASLDPTQRRLMMIFPLVLVVVLYRYPAGLLVYWITTNLWSVGQGYFIRRTTTPPPALGSPATGNAIELAASNGNGDSRGGPSGQPALVGSTGAGAAHPSSNRRKKKPSGRRR